MLLSGIKYLLSGLGRGLLGVVMQFLKFGLVLLVAYMTAIGIFYAWEYNISTSMEKRLKTQRTNRKDEVNSEKNVGASVYPHVVEMPTIESKNSIKSTVNSESGSKTSAAAVSIQEVERNSTGLTSMVTNSVERITPNLSEKLQARRQTLENELEKPQGPRSSSF